MPLPLLYKDNSIESLKQQLDCALSALKGIARYRKYPKRVAKQTLNLISEIRKEKNNETVLKRS